jgi:hypothetical protein
VFRLDHALLGRSRPKAIIGVRSNPATRPVHPLGRCGMMRGPAMMAWRVVRSFVALLLLLLAATEILACDANASPACLFSIHTSHDSDDGCSADGCLCCCGHIVVVPPIVPVAAIGIRRPGGHFR